MQTKMERFLELLSDVKGSQDIQKVVEATRDLYGIEHVVYHSKSGAGEHSVAFTYAQHWADRYVEKDYVRIDPVVQGCYERFHPVDWKQLDWSSKTVRQFHREALEGGVGRQGFSVPIRGPHGQFAMFSISDNCSDDQWARYTDEHVRDMILVGHYLNQKVLELDSADGPAEGQQALSPREIDVLTLLGLGYSRAQAAESLNISEHTLRVYIDTARFKLGAANTTHAVAKALVRGLITV